MSFFRRIKPPLWLLAGILVMVVLHVAAPVATLPRGLRFAGPILMALGVGLAAWGAATFRRAGTNIVPFREATALVTTGPFQFTRNPMYVGILLGALGVALLLGSATPFVVPPLLALLLHFAFVRAEEPFMRATFGPDYDAYCAHVRRWV